MASAELIESLGDLEALRDEWDALAVATGRPFCAPAWMLAAAHHLISPRGRLAAVAVRDAGTLVGLAPFWVARRAGVREARLLGGGMAHRIGPLTLQGHGNAVAALTAPVLADVLGHAGAIRVEGADAAEHWAGRLAGAWPDRAPRVLRELVLGAPTLSIDGRDFEGWLSSKSVNFRQWARRVRRRAQARGAVVSMASDAGSLAAGLEAFRQLHEARWAQRGGTVALRGGAPQVLREAGQQLIADGRFRLWTLEIDGSVASAQVFVAAGGEVSYWNGGFDERWSSLSPALVTILAAVEDAFERHERRIDLGGGEHHYKTRIADGDHPVIWETVLPRGVGYPLARLSTVPRQARRGARHVARRWLAPETVNRLKRLRPHR